MKFVGAPRVAHRVGRYVAWRRPPPWTTLHCCEPPELHLSFGESCSNKPSHLSPTGYAPGNPALNNWHLEVSFIDTGVTDWQTLADGVHAGVEVVLIDAGQSGLAQMALWAQDHAG